MQISQNIRPSKKQAANQRKKQEVQINVDDLTKRWEYFRKMTEAETQTYSPWLFDELNESKEKAILTNKFNHLNELQEKWLGKLVMNYRRFICPYMSESFWKKEIFPRVIAKYSFKIILSNAINASSAINPDQRWIDMFGDSFIESSTVGTSRWITVAVPKYGDLGPRESCFPPITFPPLSTHFREKYGISKDLRCSNVNTMAIPNQFSY